jgi:hypothetical protein
MFTRTFSVGRNHALKRAVSLVLALGFVVGALLLAGCPMEDDDTSNLVSHWQNIYAEGTENEYITNIHITDTTVVYENSYEAAIVNSPDFEAKYGILIIQFTKYLAPDYTNWPAVEYQENPANVGKYAGLYWNDLTSSSVKLADAYDKSQADPVTGSGAVHKIVDDLETARSTFTDDAVSDFIDWSGVSPYNRK